MLNYQRVHGFLQEIKKMPGDLGALDDHRSTNDFRQLLSATATSRENQVSQQRI
jgi:hypothetical protein